MKKRLCLVVLLSLCMTLFFGCDQNAATPSLEKKFCRVVCVETDGIVVDIEYVGYVYVKMAEEYPDIAPLKTVVIEYSANDLKEAHGTFVDCFGEEQQYAYTLENPTTIRWADPSAGEPTFG